MHGLRNRFEGWEINEVTVLNHRKHLPESLIQQVEMFLPPNGSFDTKVLRRYLENVRDYQENDESPSLSLANKLRLAFQNMEADTICNKFPTANPNLKRRLRCVAEYLIRSEELEKMRDENGKLVKKRGAAGKLVVIYCPLPKIRQSLIKQGFIKDVKT